MLSVLLWILAGIGILCIIVFPGKRKGALPIDRETMISDAACNIAVTGFILNQMLFPLYGYYISAVRFPNAGSSWDGNFVEFKRITSSIVISFPDLFDNRPLTGVYGFLMLTAVFCFFAGMSIYKNGIRTGQKLFWLIPLVLTIVQAFRFLQSHGYAKKKFNDFLMYEAFVQIDVILRYLCGAFFMIAALYGIYLLLKKILKNELIPLIVILVLSFFTPGVRVVNDGVNIVRDAMLKDMIFGPDIPLFPMGMIVMKYKDKMLPKTKKGIIIHLASWLFVGGISFYALYGIQHFLIKQAGVRASDALTDIWYDGLGTKLAKLEKIYKVDSIPWLIFGLALSMVLLSIALLVRTGNPVTKFLRDHCYLITVLLFSRHVFFEAGRWNMDFWTNTLGMTENMLIIVPFIYFVLSVVLAFLIRRFIFLAKNVPAKHKI